MSQVKCPVKKPCKPNLYTFSQSVSGASRKQAFSVKLMFLTAFQLSQSVRGNEEEQRRQSVSSLSPNVTSCQVRHQTHSTNFLLFVGRATQLWPGESHGECQAEGCYVSKPLQGEGRVTPAHTTDHVDQAQLYRHVVELHQHHLCLLLQLQEDVQGGGEASLIHINTAIAI